MTSANMCENMECPICMENIELTKNCVTTECGHAFHTNCLMKNVVFNGFGCPFCRTEMVEDVSDESEYEDDEEEDVDDEEDIGSDDDEDEEDEDEDDDGGDLEDFVVPDADANEENQPLPSFELLEKKLIEKGITYKCLVKAFISSSLYYYYDKHPNYEDCTNCDEKIEEIILNTSDNYEFEQEEVDSVNEYNFYFLQNEYKERKYSTELETTIANSLSLDNIDEDVEDYDYDTFVANILKDINAYNNNYLQVF
jgi:hypothetical protein